METFIGKNKGKTYNLPAVYFRGKILSPSPNFGLGRTQNVNYGITSGRASYSLTF